MDNINQIEKPFGASVVNYNADEIRNKIGENMYEEKEKTSGLHKDIKYTTRENGEVSGFRFTSDEGREKFRQMQILNVLKMEVMSTMGIRFYRGSIVNVLKGYFPDIPRTKKGAYKYLKARGYYPEDEK